MSPKYVSSDPSDNGKTREELAAELEKYRRHITRLKGIITGQQNTIDAHQALRAKRDGLGVCPDCAGRLREELVENQRKLLAISEDLEIHVEELSARREELLEAQEGLRESEEIYRRIVEMANEGIWTLNRDNVTTFVNPQMARMLGYSLEEIIGRTPYDFLDDAYREEVRNHLENRHRGTRNQYTCKYLRKDGSALWAIVSGTPLYDGNGEYTGAMAMITDISGRKLAEEALRESEERFRATFEQAAVGIAHVGLDGKWLRFNQKLCEITGYTRDELSKLTFQAITHPDDLEADVRSVERLLASGIKTYSMEKRYVRKNGSIVWVNLTVSLLLSDGRPEHFISVVEDITERKRAEEALRESEERLRRASCASGVGLFEWNIDKGMVYLRPEASELYGIGMDSPVTYEMWLATIHPDDRGIVERIIAEARERASNTPSITIKLEYRVVHGDGAVLWLLATATCNIEGSDLIVRGAVRDITDRKRAEAALQESEERLRRACNAGRIGLFEWNVDRGLIYSNPETYELYGLEPGSPATLDKFFARVHPDDREMVERKFTEDCKSARRMPVFSVLYEYRVVHDDGMVLWLEILSTFAFEGGARILWGSVRDVTERKRAETELAEAKAQAELYVDLMGHDINNYNQTARGYLELLDGMVEDEKLKELVAKPVEAIDGSSRLIRYVQKLQRARSSGGQAEVMDLGAIVEEVAGQFASSPDRSVNITCDAVKGVRVRAGELLQDVFINLVGNAIKHSPGSARVSIRIVPEEMDGRGYCRVTIDDNGPGVPDDMKEKIFNRLSRGNTKATGSGLGLYLVKTLVESYGGRVWAEDRVKGDHTQGARFVVILPTVR